MSSWQRDREARCNVTGDDGRNDSDGGCGKYAARQVLQHLALETVVMVRMSRATGDGRRIDVMRLRSVCMAVASRERLCRLRKPWKRAERRPGQRHERDPRDSSVKSPHSPAMITARVWPAGGPRICKPRG